MGKLEGEGAGPKRQKRQARFLRQTTRAIPDYELALGRISIQKPNKQKIQRATVLGIKYTQDPSCLGGACLTAGVRKMREILERGREPENGERDNSMILQSRSPCRRKLTQDQMDRWRIYQATADSLSNRTEFGDLACCVARRKELQGIFLVVTKAERAKEDQAAQRIWKARRDVVKE